MMLFCQNGVFTQGNTGQYPGNGVGFDSGCGYGDAVILAPPGSVNQATSDIGQAANVCGSAFDAFTTGVVETANGFDISGFELNNYDIDMEGAYGIRYNLGPQDNCCTICFDLMLDLIQGSTCGQFGAQNDLSSFGYPIPAMFGQDIFGEEAVPYSAMCPNTEYFFEYQVIGATAVDLSDPDANNCAMDDGLITSFGQLSTGTLVAPGTRDPIVINTATLALAGAADCNTNVVLDYNIDISSGCTIQFPGNPPLTCSKGIEYEFRAALTCGDQSTLAIGTGALINDPEACLVGTGTLGGQAPSIGQITLGTVAEVCAILQCDPNASLDLYATHTFCEADDINGDGTGSDEAVMSISLASILAEYSDAGAMCCTSACDEFDNLVLFGSSCNAVTYGIGWQTDAAGVPLDGATEDPANYTWTVNSPIAGTQLDQIGFFDTDGDGAGDFLGNIITYTADALAQGCEPVAFPTTLDVLCPDGTVAVLNLAAGPVNLTALDVIDLFGLTPLLYPDVANFTLDEVPGSCGTAATVTITAPDGTVCFSDMGNVPATPACDSGVTNSEPLDYDVTLGSPAMDPDPLVPDGTCEMQFTGTVLADCAAVVCPTVCPDIASLAASTTDVCTGDNITVTLTLSTATEGGETIEVNNTAPDAPNNPIPAGVTILTYTIAAPANTGCASAPLSISVTTATCMDASPITDNSMAAMVNVFPNTFTTAITDDGSTCGTPSIDLIAADGATVCETITGMACVLDGDATAYDFATGTALTGFPAACIPAGLSGTLTCSGCAVACPTVALTDAMPTICGGALATEFADWQAAVVAANPATDPDGTSTGIVYSSINDNTAPDGDVSGITGMNMTCDPTTQIVYAFLGCDTTLPADDTPDSFQLAGTFTLTINPVLTAMEIAGSDMTAGCSTYMAALFAADGTQCAGTEMAATCVANGDVLSIDFPADANACYAAQNVTAPSACAGCGMCAITPGMATAIACDNNDTPTDPSDDTFTFTITVNGNNPAVGASQTFNDDQGNTGIAYGTAVNYGSYPIAGGNITVNFTDADDPMCTGTMMAAAPATCSGESCGIMPNMATNIQCNDNDTPADPSDDTYTFDITVNGDNPAAGATNTFNDDQGNTGIAYGTLVSYGPYSIAGGNITVNFTDADDPMCTGTMMAAAPATCSVVCNGDIAGTIILADCDFTGTIVTIFDDTGAVVGTTMADMMGNYMLAGPFECGNYTVELTAVPPCYVNEDGDVGPRAFVIDGDDTPDGFDFGVTPANIPTVGEWGLIILGLLMSITAIVGIRQRREEEATAS